MELYKDNCLITPSGIRFKNRLYWDAELMHRAKEKVRVLYNRDCLDSITICTMPGANGKISRFICEAVPKDTLEYVGEDEEKLARYCAISKVQERQLRRGLAAKGIAPYKKRSSGFTYYDDVDEALVRGQITNMEAEAIAAERTKARKAKATADALRDDARRTGPDKVTDMFKREYDALQARKKA